MSLYNYYVCGFNGFNQVEECPALQTASDKISENSQQLIDSSVITTDTTCGTSCSTLSNSSALNAVFDQTVSEKIYHSCHDNKLGTLGNISQEKSSCFNQIQPNSSQSACSHSQNISSPKLLTVEPVLWTWSQMWTKSPSGKLRCSHYMENKLTALYRQIHGVDLCMPLYHANITHFLISVKWG